MVLVEIEIVSSFVPVLVDESKNISEQVKEKGFSVWRMCSARVDELLKLRAGAIKLAEL